ncbi:Pycsar system effector family protein [Streptomyces olivaceus]|uniref:Pycsar system effector family protein n=1 Tax=Streptomyces olivaceus TaxID=47716 RepID=UPI0022EFCD37|nr:Pycsar system effector family protein [Streptomyces olivaceus]GHI91730.1 integral membrane plasmid transfer protein [Streptomyces olivaceus]
MQPTDQTSRNLDTALAHTVSEITRTDTKASALLTLDGLLVAALGLLGTDVHGPALAVAVLGGLTLVAAVVLALLVIRPRLGVAGTTDRSGFIYWAAATPDTITTEMTEDRRPARLQVLSTLCLRKMRTLRAAGDTSLAAVVLTAAALLLR